MSTFYFVCYILSLVIAILTLFGNIYVGIKRYKTFNILPKALNLYLLVCCLPYMTCITFVTIHISIYYLVYDFQQHWSIEVSQTLLTFSSQQIRNSMVTIVLKRIVATVKLEKHNLHSTIKLCWILSLPCYGISLIYTLFNLYCRFVPGYLYLNDILNYIIFGIHVFIISKCIILQILNKQIYKASAYQITLKRRYMIFENIKISSFLFPSLLIYALLAQGGPIIFLFFHLFNLPTIPCGVHLTFYNLSFLLIYVRHFFIHTKNESIVVAKATTTISVIKNPFGKNLPVVVSTDAYFKDLQLQWK